MTNTQEFTAEQQSIINEVADCIRNGTDIDTDKLLKVAENEFKPTVISKEYFITISCKKFPLISDEIGHYKYTFEYDKIPKFRDASTIFYFVTDLDILEQKYKESYNLYIYEKDDSPASFINVCLVESTKFSDGNYKNIVMGDEYILHYQGNPDKPSYLNELNEIVLALLIDNSVDMKYFSNR